MKEDKKNPFAPYELQIDVKTRKNLISQILRELRVANSYEQKELAELLGIPATTYNGYEKARSEIPIEYLVRLSFLYDVPMDLLTQKYVFYTDDAGVVKQIKTYQEEINNLAKSLNEKDTTENEAGKLILQALYELTENIKDWKNDKK